MREIALAEKVDGSLLMLLYTLLMLIGIAELDSTTLKGIVGVATLGPPFLRPDVMLSVTKELLRNDLKNTGSLQFLSTRK